MRDNEVRSHTHTFKKGSTINALERCFILTVLLMFSRHNFTYRFFWNNERKRNSTSSLFEIFKQLISLLAERAAIKVVDY